MASLIPGYEYDIFISYRQKDNKGDKWVSKFVDALKTELEATFKDDISVYFDENPHDRLQENHNVDKSLEGKLKCLIFIPILSQTYCDQNSYAWQYEFLAFNKLAKEDRVGRDIKLRNGNYASRILPIRIHDLEQEDVKLFEKETGSVLRAMDFVFKTASGVNRPLKANEAHPNDNLNKTFYTDQINKTANAIKEIISGLKTEATSLVKEKSLSKESKNEVKFEDKRKDPDSTAIFNPKSKKRIIILLSVFLFIAGAYAIYKIKDRSKQTQDLTKLEKSIAVLPFINDSPDKENAYFVNGIMDEIINNLQKIKDFRALSRLSVERYRGETKLTFSEIAKKLNVHYIVDGSGQKYGNKIVLRVELIAAENEKHLWGDTYKQEIHETSDLINIQSQIAQSIAAELKATMTTKEKQLIDKIPTTNLTAYDFYQRGREEYTKYWIDKYNTGVLQKDVLQKAEDLYRKALKYDSTYAQAYTGLARVYWDKHYWEEYLSENFMDSVLILTNHALSFDNQLSEANTLRGTYYCETGKPELAIEEFDKAIKLNPNDWMAYYEKGRFYQSADLVNPIYYLQKAASINRGAEFPSLLGGIGGAYFDAGFPEKAKQYYKEELKLDGDSLSYYDGLSSVEFWLANFNKSIEFAEKGYAIDSTNEDILYCLGHNYSWLGKYKESLKYYKKYYERLITHGALTTGGMHRIGYAYWQNGYKKEAEYYFNEQIKYCNRMIELKRSLSGLNAYYDLAGVYAFRGEKDKAYKSLKSFDQMQRIPLWMSMLIKTDPLFDSIRNEPEFQQIARDIEAKYQTEHERVRKWLEEQGKP